MKNICLINGSLRGKKAASLEFLNDVNRRLPDNEYNKRFVTVKAVVKTDYPEGSLKSLANADAIIFVFPLYTYGLPGALMRLLEDYYQYIKTGKYNKEANVYVIINCAYPWTEKTTPACFSQSRWRAAASEKRITGTILKARGAPVKLFAAFRLGA